MSGKIGDKIKNLKVCDDHKMRMALAGTLTFATLFSIRLYTDYKERERHTNEYGILDEYYVSVSGRKIWTAREYTLASDQESSSLYAGINLSELEMYEWEIKTEDYVSWYANLTEIESNSNINETPDAPNDNKISKQLFDEITIPVYAFKIDSEKTPKNEKIIRGVDGDSYSIRTEEILGPDGCYYLVFPDYIRMENGSVRKVAGSAEENLIEILNSYYNLDEGYQYKK